MHLEKAKSAAIKAGKEIIKIYNQEFQVDIKWDNSPVTIADKKANEIILKELKETWIKILSEEEIDDLSRLDEKYLWVVDPLDWTKDFINKTWEFSIMIWLIQNWTPILWIVYLPIKDKLYFAEKWKWAYLQQNWVTSKLKININNSKVLISRNHTTNIEKEIIDELDLDFKLCWSIWVKLWLISEWKAWNYINLYSNLSEWDTCAPQIILYESWWKITNKNWNNLIYNKVNPINSWCIATNWNIHNDIINKIKNKTWI